MASTSLRAFFEKKGIRQYIGPSRSPVISLRLQCKYSPQSFPISLKKLIADSQSVNDGFGSEHGCREDLSGSNEKDVKKVLLKHGFLGRLEEEMRLERLFPAWAPVASPLASKTRALEGVVTRSEISYEDFPYKPWHKKYDINIYVDPDQQYHYLLSTYHTTEDMDISSWRKNHGEVIEVEWENHEFIPWAWPDVGSRIIVIGDWIYDCGHPSRRVYRTEIHPPKAIISFRKVAVKFRENQNKKIANIAAVYISKDGGYIVNKINDQNYEFDIPLPPKFATDAEPVWAVESKTGELIVQPICVAYPAGNPAAIRVIIPLKGKNPQPASYGCIISVGWADPARRRSTTDTGNDNDNSTPALFKKRVTLTYASNPPGATNATAIYMAVNGRGLFTRPDGREFSFGLDLDLDALGIIRICFGGFFIDDLMDREMGVDSGLDWRFDVANSEESVAGLVDKALSNSSLRSGFRELYNETILNGLKPPSNKPFSAKPHFFDSNGKRTPLVREYLSYARVEEEIKFNKYNESAAPVWYSLKINIKDR
jgi:hypothetical protein